MSRVFVATEARLHRKVVIKLLNPEVAAAVSAERFEREMQLAAQLQEPRIVPVVSAGEAAGLPYYTMPFVEGESLRERLTGVSGQCGKLVRYCAGVRHRVRCASVYQCSVSRAREIRTKPSPYTRNCGVTIVR
jgi:serine/threonine protein kinase